MLARHHAALGAVAGIGIARLAGLRPAADLAAGVAAAGAALVADIDESGSTVARSFGILSEAVSSLAHRFLGGHRQASHSLLAVVLGLASVAALGLWRIDGYPASLAVLLACFALGLHSLIPRPLRPGRFVTIVVAAVATWATWRFVGTSWLAWTVALGWGTHLVGDSLTASGVPLLWPWRRPLALPVLERTGSGRERVVGFVLFVTLAVLAFAPARAVLALH